MSLHLLMARARTNHLQNLWTPSDLTTKPKIWLRDDSPVTDAGGGACDRWDDISGNSYNFQAITTGARPSIISAGMNGRRTIRFDGLAQGLASISDGARNVMRNQSSGWCMAVIRKLALDASDTTRGIFAVTNGTTVSSRFYASLGPTKNQLTLNTRRLDSDSTVSLDGPVFGDVNYHLCLLVSDFADQQSAVWYDGASAATGVPSSSAGLTSNTESASYLGLGTYFGTSENPTNRGDIELAEVIVGAGAVPTSDEIDRLFGYTAGRWGLQSLLPAGHPYKTRPPTR